jgi:2-oxoglutarate dehydrogenase E1 component
MALNHLTAGAPSAELAFELKVLELIQGYRELGYLVADVNPLNRGFHSHPLLKLDKFGLTEADLDRVCEVGNMIGKGPAPLAKIIETLKAFYCSPASVEFGHIEDPRSRLWIQKRIESGFLSKPLALEIKKRALTKLVEAEVLETFLHKRFVGQKRFSVEGTDVIIPMLDLLINQAGQLGADEILVAMAHRGRLNVLANIFQKDLKQMMGEFSGNFDANVGDGDVKYHMGFSQKTVTESGKPMHLSLMPNPSHLEAVNSVLQGVCRSKQKLKGDTERNRTLAVMLHGDASFSGQGPVYELLNMADLTGYTIGGTIHIIVNNQIGFTTIPQETRSTPQCTDVAKMMEFPIFHVNADEPEAALRCMSMALQFRYKFKRDVIIDVVGYRRYGHNEADEPTFTQPILYRMIEAHSRVREIYQKRLVAEGVFARDDVDRMMAGYEKRLEDSLAEARKTKVSALMPSFGDRWKDLHRPTEKDLLRTASTGVPEAKLKQLGERLTQVPGDFHLHPKGEKFLEERQKMLAGERGIDWSFAEALAFATLLAEGRMVRLAGQDSERGTFSQRHSVFHDVVNGKKYNPFNNLQEGQADFEVVNSLLSEFAAMGFEFGQSLANPNKLTLWEAQFGDFVNGAQVIVDQFLTCSAFKWNRYSGLTLLLPHGYEGQGPEHSSARLERFLTACAQNNIQVCNMSTPAQYFHVLRRQLFRKFRLPLVIMSPKSLLRHPRCVSSLEDLAQGFFQELIHDPQVAPERRGQIRRVVFCSGKIYYELLEAKEKAARKDLALVRVEQFYPFPAQRWAETLASYPKAAEIVWCQEGPQNMEGWNFILQHVYPLLAERQSLRYVGRAPQASPADSFLQTHLREQKRIVGEAIG